MEDTSLHTVAKLLEMRIHNDGAIEMVSLCPQCGTQNVHNINVALKLMRGVTVVDFSSLGLWPCRGCFLRYELSRV